MVGTAIKTGVVLGVGLALGFAVSGVGLGPRTKAAGGLDPVSWVYTPPRELYLNFWVPGTYSRQAFGVTLNGQKVNFNVADQSTLSLESPLPFGTGEYTVAGTLTLPHVAGAVFPAATTVDVADRADKPRWSPVALDASTAVALDAMNTWRAASGQSAFVWSSSLQLAADHHRAYRAAHPANTTDLSLEASGASDFTGTTPLARATLAGYLGSGVSEWNGTRVARNPLAVVAELAHGVFGRFFWLNAAATRIGLAVDPQGMPVIDSGVEEPNPIMANIVADPGPHADDVPTAWDDREDPNPWPHGPNLTGYPIVVMLEGWNLTGPFSIQLTTSQGVLVPSHLVAPTAYPGLVALIPERPLQPGRVYDVAASVEASDPLTAISNTKRLTYRFRTAAAGLTLKTVSGSANVAIGHTTLVQLTSLNHVGVPKGVGQRVQWQVGPGLEVVARTQKISPSGLAEALILAKGSARTSGILVRVGSKDAHLKLTVRGAGDRPGVANVKARRLIAQSRLATVAAIAEETARVSKVAPQEAILLAQNPADSVETLLLEPLAHALNAPLLLTETGSKLGLSTRRVLILMHITRVFLVNGKASLGKSLPSGIRVVGHLDAKGPVALAAEVASALAATGHPYHQAMVILNRSQDWADGLSVGPVAAAWDLPILFVTASGQIPAPERRAFRTVTQTFVVGAAVAARPDLPQMMDLAGNNRYDTALLVDHEFFPNGLSALILTSALPGHVMPAFASVDLAAWLRAPIVLMAGPTLSLPTQSWLAQVHWSTAPKLEVIGAFAAVPKAAVAMVRGLMES